MSDSDDDSYVPALPPGFKSKQRQKENEDEDSRDPSDSESFAPSLPPHMKKNSSVSDSDHSNSDDSGSSSVKRKHSGSEDVPAKHVKSTEEDEDSVDEEDMYGPALPPHLIKNKSQSSVPKAEKILGPTLPAGYVPPKSLSPFQLPEEEEESEEEDGPLFGPLPSNVAFNEKEYRAQQFELRAQRMKDKLAGKSDISGPQKRESWMLELPEDKPNFCGLAPRQFLKKAPQEKGDRSVWTDTPSDRKRKEEMEAEEEEAPIDPITSAAQRRDEDLTARVEQHNKQKRAKALIDLHKKEMKKKEKQSGPKERRPFSREEDMNVNKFDEAQKNNILKKARQLNDRFNPGDRKFL